MRASKEVILPGDTIDLLCHVAGAHQRPRVLWSRLGASFLPDNVIVAGNMLTVSEEVKIFGLYYLADRD